MKICFPIEADNGINSVVYGHFGSAPNFLVCDDETMETFSISNNNEHHEHGMCNPIGALQGNNIDALLVQGMGGNAFIKLNMAGIKVFQAQPGTISHNLCLFKANALPEFSISHSCHGHEHHHTN